MLVLPLIVSSAAPPVLSVSVTLVFPHFLFHSISIASSQVARPVAGFQQRPEAPLEHPHKVVAPSFDRLVSFKEHMVRQKPGRIGCNRVCQITHAGHPTASHGRPD